MKSRPTVIDLLHRAINAVVIVVTAIFGNAGTSSVRVLNDSMTLDSAKSLSGRSFAVMTSHALAAVYGESADAIDESATEVLPAVIEYALTCHGDAGTQHTAFGAGSFALNALGFSASAEHRKS
ncbi:hypothetical protein [Paraburkholderia hospita]|uniref:Uncharacterized protein n=1 Tax=Paraburkholderia hospita TaxID=169430 RepID=A0ABN0F7Z6_9BURK|nr:hypothetical protein [Paraburkholderia hospita]EIM94751.1 hypothetical protein WQE_42914 [Paraburkholderia hospita]OUL79432.1 hypothetical protein CA601_34725 [Paraburkholderia hospita]OUL85082.1 hypothetical protein CA603_23845 [Paraburkholderia hospita]OUL86754.1 hypothetical protein CA602_15150 [Paraburkholderia hospita]